MDDFIDFFMPFILFVVVMVFLIIGAVYFSISYQCSTYQEMTGIKTEQKALTCYVENNNRMIPYKEYLARYTASEIGK